VSAILIAAWRAHSRARECMSLSNERVPTISCRFAFGITVSVAGSIFGARPVIWSPQNKASAG
jgi:hypothetical protein